MFKTLLHVLKQRNLMIQALDLTEEALDKAEHVTRAALAALMDGVEADFNIYDADREINAAEIEVRRLIFQHLAVNPAGDLTPALIVTSIIIDIERIGDYAKNIHQVAEAQQGSFPTGALAEEVRSISVGIVDQFGRAATALGEGNVAVARDVMGRHADLNHRCEAVIERIADGEEHLSPRIIVDLVLTTRFLKRISAHLSNMVSSVVNPFDRIGFRPDTATPEDAD
jgi:phosphate uptake regulator